MHTGTWFSSTQLGFQVNCEKIKLSPVLCIFFWYRIGIFFSVELVTMTARLSGDHVCSVLNCLRMFKYKNNSSSQRLLGNIEFLATVRPLGLMQIRPLQHWLHAPNPKWAWCCGKHCMAITQECHCKFSLGRIFCFYRHCSNRCFQDRLGCYVQWACSFGDLDRSPSALEYHLPRVIGCASRFEEVLTVVSGQACASLDRQHSNGNLYHPAE